MYTFAVIRQKIQDTYVLISVVAAVGAIILLACVGVMVLASIRPPDNAEEITKYEQLVAEMERASSSIPEKDMDPGELARALFGPQKATVGVSAIPAGDQGNEQPATDVQPQVQNGRAEAK